MCTVVHVVLVVYVHVTTCTNNVITLLQPVTGGQVIGLIISFHHDQAGYNTKADRRSAERMGPTTSATLFSGPVEDEAAL